MLLQYKIFNLYLLKLFLYFRGGVRILRLDLIKLWSALINDLWCILCNLTPLIKLFLSVGVLTRNHGLQSKILNTLRVIFSFTGAYSLSKLVKISLLEVEWQIIVAKKVNGWCKYLSDLFSTSYKFTKNLVTISWYHRRIDQSQNFSRHCSIV